MTNLKIHEYVMGEGFAIDPLYDGGFDFDVDISHLDADRLCVSLDAVKVYRTLKDYFKGSEYE